MADLTLPACPVHCRKTVTCANDAEKDLLPGSIGKRARFLCAFLANRQTGAIAVRLRKRAVARRTAMLTCGCVRGVSMDTPGYGVYIDKFFPAS